MGITLILLDQGYRFLPSVKDDFLGIYISREWGCVRFFSKSKRCEFNFHRAPYLVEGLRAAF